MTLYEIIGRQIEELFLISSQKDEWKELAEEKQGEINSLVFQLQHLLEENEALKRGYLPIVEGLPLGDANCC